MKRYRYILLIISSAILWGCQSFDETLQDEIIVESLNTPIVERLDNGQIRVEVALKSDESLAASVASRASNYEDVIYSGWCLVFGEDNTDPSTYTSASPLLQKKPLLPNANGTFFITFDPYDDMAFMRIVVNLTPREETTLAAANAWNDQEGALNDDGSLSRPTNAEVNTNNIATFGDYIYQSVGLDGIYDMSATYGTDWYTATVATDSEGTYLTEQDSFNSSITNLVYTDENSTSPDPTKLSSSFPMSSIGFVMDKIDEEHIEELFENEVHMVRTCSKLDIYNGDSAGFEMSEIYLLDAANEARLRSTVLTSSGTDGNDVTTDFGVPNDLGGTVDYLPLKEAVGYGQISSPIYFYPNSGGDYNSSDGPVDQGINPQYVIIKGRAAGYDTDGYYKVALKAQYPLTYNYDSDGNIIDVATWSNLTYDILRNTHFTIDIKGVDKPGYKTLEEAKSPSNPASNISYSITIDCSDGRNEILVSNGTYFVELSHSRVYAKGYSELTDGTVEFTIKPSSGNTSPITYVMGDYQVSVANCIVNDNSANPIGLTTITEEVDYEHDIQENWVVIPASDTETKVVVNFTASGSGRIRLRIGDILKYIPVGFDSTAALSEGETLKIFDETEFAYEEIAYDDGYSDSSNKILNKNGKVEENETTLERELRAKLYMADGVTRLYLKQNKMADPNEKGDGNTIDFSDLTGVAEGESADEYDSAEFVQAVIDVLTNNYTTVYVDLDYTKKFVSNNGLSSDVNNVFNDIKDEIADLIKADVLDEDFTFTLDLSEMDRTGDGEQGTDAYPAYNTVFKHTIEGLFSGNTYINKLILPSSTYEIHQNSFYGCTNLKEVLIGSETDPAYDYDAVYNSASRKVDGEEFILSSNSFNGMALGCTITIYTTSTMVDRNTTATTNYSEEKTDTGIKYTVPIVKTAGAEPVDTEMPITKYFYTITSE